MKHFLDGDNPGGNYIGFQLGALNRTTQHFLWNTELEIKTQYKTTNIMTLYDLPCT